MAEFALGDIFRSAFGYELPESSFQSPEDLFKIPQAATPRQYSKLGTPYYASEVVSLEDYANGISGREFFLPVWLDGLLIPFAVIGMTWKKTFVTTPMPERGGSVKELISIDDYVISIKGIIINDDGSFPEAEMTKLHELFRKNESVTLRNVMTDMFLNGAFNSSVVIKDIKWPIVAGCEHAKPFDMEVESDMIFELVKKKN